MNVRLLTILGAASLCVVGARDGMAGGFSCGLRGFRGAERYQASFNPYARPARAETPSPSKPPTPAQATAPAQAHVSTPAPGSYVNVPEATASDDAYQRAQRDAVFYAVDSVLSSPDKAQPSLDRFINSAAEAYGR